MDQKQSCQHHQRDISCRTAKGQSVQPHQGQITPDDPPAASQSKKEAEDMPDFGRKAGNCKPCHNPLSMFNNPLRRLEPKI